MDDIRLFICTLGSGRGPFIDCLTSMTMVMQKAGIEVKIVNIRGSLLIEGRTEAAKLALKHGATHTLWIDDDMYFHADVGMRLLEHDKDVVACNYVTKDMKFRPVTSNGITEDDRVSSVGKTGLEKVLGIGFGVVLIKASVYDRLEFPWFAQRWLCAEHLKGKPVIGIPNWDEWYSQSEDVWFCRRCINAGIDVFLDHDASQNVGHWGGVTFFHEGIAVI